MNRFEILILDRKNGIICNQYMDEASAVSFLVRSGNHHRYQVMARKGKKALYIEKIDLPTLAKELNDFNLQTPNQ